MIPPAVKSSREYERLSLERQTTPAKVDNEEFIAIILGSIKATPLHDVKSNPKRVRIVSPTLKPLDIDTWNEISPMFDPLFEISIL